MIRKDVREIRKKLSGYIKKYKGKKIYISKYNKIIGEMRFYTDKQKEHIMLEIAKEIVKDNNSQNQINLFS